MSNDETSISRIGSDFISPIRVSKSDAAFARAEAASEKFDFILIDGSHKVRAVMSDLRWSRLVNVGGIICLHDYSSRFLGVQMAANHFLRRNRNYKRIALVGSLLALRKSAVSSSREINRADEFYALALHLPLKLIANWRKKRTKAAEYLPSPIHIARCDLAKKWERLCWLKFVLP